MKVIIEEGDPTKLTPGVYDANESGLFVDCLGADEIYLKANISIDMNQKPKPVPAGGRYDIEFRRFERVDPDDTVYEIYVHDKVDPDKTFTSRRIMANTLFLRYTLAESREMVQHELRRLAYKMADHFANQAIAAMGFSGNPFRTEAFTNHVKPTDPPPVATCDKTFKDCERHGNTLQYRGYTNINTGRHVSCPLMFGDPSCIGAKFKTPPVIGVDPQGRPLVINDGGLIDYALADVDVVRKMLRANRDLPEGVNPSTFLDQPKDCDVCYGTGRFKAFGGPCSEGCPTKGGK